MSRSRADKFAERVAKLKDEYIFSAVDLIHQIKLPKDAPGGGRLPEYDVVSVDIPTDWLIGMSRLFQRIVRAENELGNVRFLRTFTVGDRITWGTSRKAGDVIQVMPGGRYRVRYEPPGVRATTVLVEPGMNPRAAPIRKVRQEP